jgi:aryl-alcohol dehydrogenase-like predicted oxidoreductase
MNRRMLLQLLVSGSVLPHSLLTRAADSDVLMKPIPATGEMIPVIGLGTFKTFQVGNNSPLRNQRADLMKAFFDLDGVLIDSSPMYQEAEEVVGDGLVSRLMSDGIMSSSKVWNVGPQEGRAQFEKSLRDMQIDTIDIYMIHNVVEGWQAHLDVLKEHKENGRIRYLGMGTSHGREHAQLEKIMDTQALDFVQLTYNVADRGIENRLLPLAQERAIAVMANRPFQGGPLFERVKDQPLPGWAAEIDCFNWAQIFLKYVVSHPAVTCAIPGTSQLAHLQENMGALRGILPDAEMRDSIHRHFSALS